MLNHSIEVSVLAATIAAELGADVNVCKVAGLLHDLGKAIDQEVEGPHMLISGEIARRFNRSPKIIHAIVAHHATESEPQSLEAAIVQAADAISAARPGARRETIDLYIKRLEAAGKHRQLLHRRREVLRHPGGPRGAHHRQAGRGGRDSAHRSWPATWRARSRRRWTIPARSRSWSSARRASVDYAK